MKKTIYSIAVILFTCSISSPGYGQKPSPELLSPSNHALIMVDHQSQMGFATKNIEMEVLRNNTGILAGSSSLFGIPTVVTTVAAKTFSGPVFPEITEFYPANAYIDRTTMNCWEDLNAHKAIVAKNRKKIVFAGLWTSVCIVGPALSAKAEGFDVYIITDACGDVSKEAHEMAINRMMQAGVKPMTTMQYILELQRDWARSETYKGVTDLIKRFGGSYGIGIQYAQEILKH